VPRKKGRRRTRADSSQAHRRSQHRKRRQGGPRGGRGQLKKGPQGRRNEGQHVGFAGSGGQRRGRQGRALSKDELLALVKRDPDAAQVRAAVMAQRFRDSVPVYGFVHFSSYRMSPVQFAALGFSAVVMRYNLRLGRCLWKEKHGGHRVMGNLTGAVRCAARGKCRAGRAEDMLGQLAWGAQGHIVAHVCMK